MAVPADPCEIQEIAAFSRSALAARLCKAEGSVGMSVRIAGMGRSVSAVGARGRRFCAAFAILGLYVQLFAAGLCTAGFASADPAAPNAFPICHTPENGSPSNQAPAQDQAHHACPYCALHCKAAMVIPPPVGAPQRFVELAPRPDATQFLIPATARFFLSAPPRGPPASA